MLGVLFVGAFITSIYHSHRWVMKMLWSSVSYYAVYISCIYFVLGFLRNLLGIYSDGYQGTVSLG